jgi:entericidin B
MTVVSQRFAGAVALFIAITLGLSSCGNTIRGIGNDLGNAVDATQDAGRSVANSVR